ncbi:MAG: response regulator transcription factor [Lachnospiraceae bacterium]|nr:response regulator transcription factor [Lachnospiraceae bacterium]
MSYRILLVEDDPQITEVIRDYFMRRREPYELSFADNGTAGMELICENTYDLVLLDVMLPGVNGFSIIREIRKKYDTPVIFITAKTREKDRLTGYELGCDDYVCKPFSLAELYAKVTALLKRSKGLVLADEMICGNIAVQRHTLQVSACGRRIELPPKELELLMVLLEHTDWVFTREMLLDRVWGYDYAGTDRTVDNHIKKLRKSLGKAGSQIKTVFGVGYKLTGKEEEIP